MFALYVDNGTGELSRAVFTLEEMRNYSGPRPTYLRIGESGERVSWDTFKAICATCRPDDADDDPDNLFVYRSDDN
jgi:hypothetical protein